MNDSTDQQLLRDYTDRGSEAAFAEIVRRHVDFVYSAARRMVGDTHLAEDVAQGVFVALARSARQLHDYPILSGWLHRTTRNLASKAVRSDVRRRAHEQEAAAMNELLAPGSEVPWKNLAPHLDEALDELSEPERDALLLRFFENKDLRDVGKTLGVSDDAAQKRVSRAVERLREFFAKRGVTVGASGLAVALSANAVEAAPAGLTLAISTAVGLGGTALATSTTAAKVIAMFTLPKTLIGIALVGAVGAGIYEARQVSSLRGQVQTLQQEQTPLAGQVAQLTRERDDAAAQLAALRDQNENLNRNTAELLRLRGEASRGRAAGAVTSPPVARGPVPTTAAGASVNPERRYVSKTSETVGEVWNYPESLRQLAFTNLTRALEELVKATNEFGRYVVLDRAAMMSFVFGQTEDARSYANELLALNAKFKGEPWQRDGETVFYANHVLGRIALQEDRLEDAKQFLLESGKSTGSPVLGSFGPNMTLARDLLQKGERDVVLEYFELCQKFWKRDELKQWTEAVKAGKSPDFGGNIYY